MTEQNNNNNRAKTIILIYPVVILFIGIAINLFAFGINPVFASLPSIECIRAIIIASILLIINHTWIMTATELTRAKFKMYATPEEWAASEINKEDAPELGILEIERHHNTHRNTTENSVYYVLLALIFIVVSPSSIAAQTWIISFPIARLGYTYSYLSGKDNARGIFMSFGLLSIYGMASYLAISLII